MRPLLVLVLVLVGSRLATQPMAMPLTTVIAVDNPLTGLRVVTEDRLALVIHPHLALADGVLGIPLAVGHLASLSSVSLSRTQCSRGRKLGLRLPTISLTPARPK